MNKSSQLCNNDQQSKVDIVKILKKNEKSQEQILVHKLSDMNNKEIKIRNVQFK